jgi:hypothetical protein
MEGPWVGVQPKYVTVLPHVRCAFSDRNLHSRMSLVPKPARFKRAVEASRRVTNGILLGCPLFLPVHTVNCVQTLKAINHGAMFDVDLVSKLANLTGNEMRAASQIRYRTSGGQAFAARCAFSDRILHSRLPLDPTHVRLKLFHACDQWHSSRQCTALTVVAINYAQTLKAVICDSGPLANTAHHPAWGRISETYGEDPYLIARTGVAVTRTMQGLQNGTLKNA